MEIPYPYGRTHAMSLRVFSWGIKRGGRLTETAILKGKNCRQVSLVQVSSGIWKKELLPHCGVVGERPVEEKAANFPE